MKILLITPGINKSFNDNYHVYKFLSQDNPILAISNKENLNKGGNLILDKEFEVDDNITIHRIFNSLHEQLSLFKSKKLKTELHNLLDEFCPDLILCEEINNLPLAFHLKHKFKIPILLRSEFIFDSDFPYRNMGRFLKKFKNSITGDFISRLIGKLIWDLAYFITDGVISCYFEDKKFGSKFSNKPFSYIPWPSEIVDTEEHIIRDRSKAVFIGAFDDHKNLPEFLKTIPILLDETPLNEFHIVGDGKYSFVVEQLLQNYPCNIKYTKSISRIDCLQLLRSSYFAYTPSTRGGWGFIGDAWATGTPLVVSSNHYDFIDGKDSLICSLENISEKVNELYINESVYSDLSENGILRFKSLHSSYSVGEKFSEICMLVLKKHSINKSYV